MFNIMVAGAQGVGKTSLPRLLLDTADISPTATADQKAAVERFLRGPPKGMETIQSACVEICESKYDRLLLSVIDTPGLDFREGHKLKLERQLSTIVKYLDSQFADTLNEDENGLTMFPTDIHVMRRIAKVIWRDLRAADLDFGAPRPITAADTVKSPANKHAHGNYNRARARERRRPEEDGHAQLVTQSTITSPISPSTTAPLSRYLYLQGPPVETKGVFVRQFRWRTVDMLYPEHCDFAALRMAASLLKIWTKKVLYEKCRTEKLLAWCVARKISEDETRRLLEGASPISVARSQS
ncbi:hypothetical protein BD311DRAFT_808447 [Dichomitus squalens]|uniref:Septin-type G domain-containing protein n=1 Tax=Dichomitus squalens TaxID=114155 RepID=A0A4Q9MGN1_9APHY|nr:hypothetical protein BD311DRAFT_808447 [Dichomitus squalens]